MGWMKSAATAEKNRKSGIKREKKGQVRKTKPGVEMGELGERESGSLTLAKECGGLWWAKKRARTNEGNKELLGGQV